MTAKRNFVDLGERWLGLAPATNFLRASQHDHPIWIRTRELEQSVIGRACSVHGACSNPVTQRAIALPSRIPRGEQVRCFKISMS
jgi:hypothetical protein